jgi:glycerol-3-phosphate dehydrogenase
LVAESARERAVWLRIAPHLVRPLPFLFPIYRGSRRPPWMVRIGMTLYDVLALFRNVESHGMLSAEDAKRLEPALGLADLVGAAPSSTRRWTTRGCALDVALGARGRGANRRTRPFDGLVVRRGLVEGVRVEHAPSRPASWSTPRAVADRVSAMAGGPSHLIRRTRGAHLVLPPLLREHALVLSAAMGGRSSSCRGGVHARGNDRSDYDERSAAVACTDERRYLLDETRRALLAWIGDADVVADFAGVDRWCMRKARARRR